MNTYTAHHVARIRHHELIDHADHVRLAREAHDASRGSEAPARQALVWLREAAGGFATRLTALTGAQAGSR